MTIDASQLHGLASSLLQGAAATAGARLGVAVAKAGSDLQAEMQAQIVGMGAVDTGAMLNSVDLTLTLGGESARAEVGPTVNYAHYVHDGTYRMAGRPYADAAAQIVAPNFVASVLEIGRGLL